MSDKKRVVVSVALDMHEDEKQHLLGLKDDVEIIAWIYDHVTWMGPEREVWDKDHISMITRSDEEISNVGISCVDVIEG